MDTFIIGAGLAGLGAGKVFNEQGTDFKIFEMDSAPGGLAKTDVVNGFNFDYAGHYLHTKTEEGYEDLIKDSIPFRKVKRKSAILISGKVVPYPIQFNLRFFNSDVSNRVLEELYRSEKGKRDTFDSLAHFFNFFYGDTMCELFFTPYNTKLWGTSLNRLPHDCVGNYLPEIDMAMLKKGSTEEINFEGYNNFFRYPESGKIGSLSAFLASSFKSSICYNSKVEYIDPKNKIIIDRKGNKAIYDYLVSSIPLNKMYRILEHGGFNNTTEYASIINVRVALKGKVLHPYHWFYIPEISEPFYRIGFPANVNKNTSPTGYTSISIEVNRKFADISEDEIAESAVHFLKRKKLISTDKIEFICAKMISPAYTYIPEKRRSEKKRFYSFLQNHGIYMAGRYGLWEYHSMEDSYLSGKRAARKILKHH